MRSGNAAPRHGRDGHATTAFRFASGLPYSRPVACKRAFAVILEGPRGPESLGIASPSEGDVRLR